jgi:hypothetical protein
MAESSLFITIVSLLALFDIRPAKDEHGNDIIPEVNMKSMALIRQVYMNKTIITLLMDIIIHYQKLSGRV